MIKVLRTDASRRKNLLPGAGEPTDIFRFGLEQRLQCTSCLGVRYRIDEQDSISLPVEAIEEGMTDEGKTIYKPVELADCLEKALGEEELEYACPQCDKTMTAIK